MSINVFRIDDRLIHGQVVTAWMNYADAQQVIVVDDKVAADAFQQTLLKMTTPKNILLKILSVNEAQVELQDEIKLRTIVIVRGPEQANAILFNNKVVNEINIGNMNMRTGKQRILDNLWLNDDEYKAMLDLIKKHIHLEYRTLPNDVPHDVDELLKGYAVN